jgi:hypothetical protein
VFNRLETEEKNKNRTKTKCLNERTKKEAGNNILQLQKNNTETNNITKIEYKWGEWGKINSSFFYFVRVFFIERQKLR